MTALQESASSQRSQTLKYRSALGSGRVPRAAKRTLAVIMVGLLCYLVRYALLAHATATSYALPLSDQERQVAAVGGPVASMVHKVAWYLRLDFVGTNQRHQVAHMVADYVHGLPGAVTSGLTIAIVATFVLTVVHVAVARPPLMSLLALIATACGLVLLIVLVKYPYAYINLADHAAMLPGRCSVGIAAHLQHRGTGNICGSSNADAQTTSLINDITKYYLAHQDGRGQIVVLLMFLVGIIATLIQIAVQGIIWIVVVAAGVLMPVFLSYRMRYAAAGSAKAIGVSFVAAAFCGVLTVVCMSVLSTSTAVQGWLT